MSLTLPGSVALGLSLAFYITGVGNWSAPYAMQSVMIGLFFGVIGSIIRSNVAMSTSAATGLPALVMTTLS